MKVKEWLKVTCIGQKSNLIVNEDFYNPKTDNEKEIDYVSIQDNGVVVIYTKE